MGSLKACRLMYKVVNLPEAALELAFFRGLPPIIGITKYIITGYEPWILGGMDERGP